ncbi:hypothetical protein ACCO45_005814 [Purpureocillium lilacinum]|uniref:Uncharacterized protein n=1 Tax=Purpureocillium lilacinum TaxID=33203 RepID=A0ACC4DWG1_PURLI
MSPLAQQSVVGYSKPTHRSASLAAQAPLANSLPRAAGSSPVTKRDGPEGQRTTSKLAEALKNPNWRDRGTDGGSFSSLNISADESRAAGLDGALSRPREWPSSSSGSLYAVEPDNINNRKVSMADRLFNVRPPTNATPRETASDRTPGRHGGEAVTADLCRVMGQVSLDEFSGCSGIFLLDVSGRNGRGSADSLDGGLSDISARMERGPVTIMPTRGRHSVARVCQPDVTVAHQGGYACQRTGGSDGFRLSSGSGHRGHHHSLGMRTGLTSSSSSARTPDSSHHSNVGEAEVISQRQPEHGTTASPTMRDVVAGGHPTACQEESRAHLDAKNEAFQRMLERLKKPAQTATLHAQAVRDAGRTAVHGHAVAHGRSRLAQPDAGRNDVDAPNTRRELTVSDFVVPYGRAKSSTHQTERSSDSATSTASSARNNSLNPKAREFLSFKQGLRPSPPRENQDSSQASGSLGLRGSQKDIARNSPGWTKVNLGAPKPVLTPEPLIRPYDRVAPNQNPNLNRVPDVRNLVPIQPAGLPYPPGPGCDPLHLPARCRSARRGAAGSARLVRWNQRLCQPQRGPEYLSGYDSGISLTSFSAPISDLAGSPSACCECLEPCSPPVPVSRPVPVPKPHFPSVSGQQAYEAYIEQRKATEPGYAMECRQRQQRRAKRNQAAKLAADRAP